MSYESYTADELINVLSKYSHAELHVHHTWKPEHKDFNGSNHQRLQDGMRNHHMNTNGWSDIAQHVTLFPDGTFLTGRDFGRVPASISGKNGSTNYIPFMIEMIGNFDTGHDKLEGKQLDSILRVAKFFDDRGKYIRFHNENAGKTCPGSSIKKDEFMKQVRAQGSNTRFSDVSKSRWSHADIEAVVQNGLMSGYTDGTFQPDQPVTREELAVVANRILRKLKG